MLNLRWKDFDLDGRKITITGSTAMIRGERVNGTTKSGRTRVVSIDEETVAVLRQRRTDQAAEQLKAGDSWHGAKDWYVFTPAGPRTWQARRRKNSGVRWGYRSYGVCRSGALVPASAEPE